VPSPNLLLATRVGALVLGGVSAIVITWLTPNTVNNLNIEILLHFIVFNMKDWVLYSIPNQKYFVLLQAAFLRANRLQISVRAWVRSVIIAWVWAGPGVKRKRSVPRGTVG
jgi:hypothetical protein